MKRKISGKQVKTEATLSLKEQLIKQNRPKSLHLVKQVENDVQFAERRIIIGLITDTHFCKWAEEQFDIILYGSSLGKLIAKWVYDHFREHQEAPHRAIEDKFHQEMQGIPKDEMQDIEEFLADLSEEYEKRPLSTEYLKKLATDYLNRRKVDKALQAIEGSGLEDQMNLLSIESLTVANLDQYMLTADQWKAKDLPKPKMLMRPWLREGQTNFFYGGVGTGKSMLAMTVGYVLGCKNYKNKNCEIGDWQVRQPVGVVYIDGEMGEGDLRERFETYDHLGKQAIPMRLFPIPDVQRESEETFDLAQRKNQKWLINWLKNHPDYKVVIIDSIQTLFSFESENDNAEWNEKVTPLLRDFRSLGVGHIILDHTGKDSKAGIRGASAKQALAENIFELKDHPSKVPGQAWFSVSNKGKQRAFGKDLNRPFNIRFDKDEEAGETFWEITDAGTDSGDDRKDTIKEKIIRGIADGLTQAEIAQNINPEWKPQNLNYYMKELREDGLITGKRQDIKITKATKSLLDIGEDDEYLEE